MPTAQLSSPTNLPRPSRPALGALAAAALPLALVVATTGAGPADAASYAATPAKPPKPTNPAALPKGPAPGRAYLAGLVLQPKAGKGTSFTLKLPASHAPHLTLLGNSLQGFVLQDDTGVVTKIYTVTSAGPQAGKVTTIRTTTERSVTYDLSHDGTRVLEGVDNYGTSEGDDVYSVFSVSGKQVAKLTNPAGGSTYPVDFSGKRTIIDVEDGFLDWTIGKPVRFHSNGNTDGADIAHDLVFQSSIYGPAVGPTSLSDPGPRPWTGFFGVESVTTNGKLVLTVRTTDSEAVFELVVRNVGNGKVRSSRTFAYSYAAWEDDTHYLLVARGPGGSAVVRCAALTGACQRTTGLMAKRVTMSES